MARNSSKLKKRSIISNIHIGTRLAFSGWVEARSPCLKFARVGMSLALLLLASPHSEISAARNSASSKLGASCETVARAVAKPGLINQLRDLRRIKQQITSIPKGNYSKRLPGILDQLLALPTESKFFRQYGEVNLGGSKKISNLLKSEKDSQKLASKILEYLALRENTIKTLRVLKANHPRFYKIFELSDFSFDVLLRFQRALNDLPNLGNSNRNWTNGGYRIALDSSALGHTRNSRYQIETSLLARDKLSRDIVLDLLRRRNGATLELLTEVASELGDTISILANNGRDWVKKFRINGYDDPSPEELLAYQKLTEQIAVYRSSYSKAESSEVIADDRIIAQALFFGVDLLIAQDRRLFETLSLHDELVVERTQYHIRGYSFEEITVEVPFGQDGEKRRLSLIDFSSIARQLTRRQNNP